MYDFSSEVAGSDWCGAFVNPKWSSVVQFHQVVRKSSVRNKRGYCIFSYELCRKCCEEIACSTAQNTTDEFGGSFTTNLSRLMNALRISVTCETVSQLGLPVRFCSCWFDTKKDAGQSRVLTQSLARWCSSFVVSSV